MKNVLIYSIPFGFGPTGKAIALANELSRYYNVTLTSFKHSLQIITDIEHVSIMDCKTRNFSEWDPKIFENIDLLISVMDLRLIEYVSQNFPRIKTVFVDSLFWWRKSLLDIPFEKCDLFLLQTFPGVKEKMKEVPECFRNKFFEVNPILLKKYDEPSNLREMDRILLHFGGVNSLIAHWEMYQGYFEFITNTTIKYARDYKCRLTVTGNKDLMNHLADCFHNEKNIAFQCLDNQDFQTKLQSTEVFITTCGIEATYEAFGSQIPTIFLPPVNSTQLHQIMALISFDFPVVVSDQLICNFNKVIESKFEYHVETKEIAETLANTINTSSERLQMENYLESFIREIKLSNDFRNDLLHKQSIFLNRAPYEWNEVLSNAFSFLEQGTRRKLQPA